MRSLSGSSMDEVTSIFLMWLLFLSPALIVNKLHTVMTPQKNTPRISRSRCHGVLLDCF
jgi:hypothetical protein